ncbi:Nn.00g046310.m01.CDS01 [Neocucurbitaria sp. VM-36]
MSAISHTAREITLPSPTATQFALTNLRTNQNYLIRISQPMDLPRAADLRGNVMPIIYILDGGALFLTASEICWARETSPFFVGGGLVVAIGHDNDITKTNSLYDARRTLDYASCGGADSFLEFVEQDVKALVRREMPDIIVGREAIFGHSFGGLCVLHALFTRKRMFDAYFACSPSIWWGENCILEEEQQFYTRFQPLKQERPNPILAMMYGSSEENPTMTNWESQDQFEKRKIKASERSMGGNARNMYKRLLKSETLREVTITEFADEDHGTVAICALARSLKTFFED